MSSVVHVRRSRRVYILCICVKHTQTAATTLDLSNWFGGLHAQHASTHTNKRARTQLSHWRAGPSQPAQCGTTRGVLIVESAQSLDRNSGECDTVARRRDETNWCLSKSTSESVASGGVAMAAVLASEGDVMPDAGADSDV